MPQRPPDLPGMENPRLIAASRQSSMPPSMPPWACVGLRGERSGWHEEAPRPGAEALLRWSGAFQRLWPLTAAQGLWYTRTIVSDLGSVLKVR